MQRTTKHMRSSPVTLRAKLQVEPLESRLTPYALTGNSWLQPQLISLSFVPDGTNLGGGTSNLQSTFDNHPNPSFRANWRKEVLRAAQVWAQQTNVNFALVSDDGSASGTGLYQQGAANFGDIRIGGMNLGPSTLASASLPQPACNYSLAGDYNFNTAQTFNLNATYDLFTVAAHEVGHGLGLGHSSITSAVMYSIYNAVKSSLRTDDISGIRAIYSASLARTQDSYDAVAANGSFATATDIGSLINSLTALLTDRDITATSDLDYYTFTAPADTTGTLTVRVQSSGLSLLSPLVRVYDANQVEIGSASGLNEFGTTLTVTVTGVSAAQQFYVMVDGADNTAFGTGRYGLTLNFGGTDPSVPLPNTQTLNGSPLQCGGGSPSSKDHDHDHDGHGHGFGAVGDADPVAEASAAQVIPLLTSPSTALPAAPVQEHLGAERSAAATVDAVFTQGAHRETVGGVGVISQGEASAVDALFAELFA